MSNYIFNCDQKCVSFEVAYAIRYAGFPQGNTDKCYLTEDHNQYYKKGQIVYNEDGYWGMLTKHLADIPTYLDVWRWLWNIKNIKILPQGGIIIAEKLDSKNLYNCPDDPEEAIINAIEYIISNNLLK